MNASDALVPASDLLEELQIITWMGEEIDTMLLRWNVYRYTTEGEPTDAIVAMHELNHQVIVRKLYLELLLKHNPDMAHGEDPPTLRTNHGGN